MSSLPAPEYALSVLGAPRFTDGGNGEPTLTQRRILERLALSAGRPVRLEQLIDAAWDTGPPRHARAAIQNQISRMRALWGEHVIETTTVGYVLGVTTDAALLQELSSRAEVLLEQGDLHEAYALSDSIVPFWEGLPFPDIEHVDGVTAMRAALSASYRSAEDTRLAAGIALGRSGWAVYEAERLVGEAPHDERRQAMRARALALAGRRGDALAAIATARRRLRADLGIDAGPLLMAVEGEILQPRAPAASRTALRFAGHERELRVALAGLARGAVVRVHGEPGSGVTRMLTEIGAHLRSLGVRTVMVDAAEHLDSAVGVLQAVAEEARLEVNTSQGLIASFPLAAARAAEVPPLAILIDNADAVGPSAWGALLAAVGARMMLVLGGHSFDARDGDSATVDVPLGPLDRAAVARLTASGVTGPLTAEAIDRLHAYSGGNPLVLEILLSAGPGAPEAAFHNSEGDTAARLSTFATHLTQDLDPADRAIVVRAAVAGDGYPVDALEDGIRLASLPRALVTITADRHLRFRHGALRDAVYFSIPPARREELHLEHGRAVLHRGAPAAIAAHHLLAAGALAGDDAVQACRAAAREAAHVGAHADAVWWLERLGNSTALPSSERLAVRIQLGDEQRLSGDPRHLDTLREVVQEALGRGDERLIADACFAFLQLGGTTTSGAPSDTVPEVVERALATLTDPSARALVCGAASLALSLTGAAARSRALFDEAEHLATDEETRARILPFAYLALGMPGDLDRRRMLTAELREIAHRRNDAVALFESWQLEYSVRLMEADGAGARHAVEQMGALIDRAGDVGRRWALQFARAAISHVEGDEEGCERSAEAASTIFGPVSQSRASAAYAGQLFGLRITQRRATELAPLLEQLVEAQPGVPAWHAAYAYATDDDDIAATHAALALDRAQEDVTWLAALTVGGRAAARVGDRELAQRYLDRLAPWSGLAVWQGTCSYGPVDTTLAMLARACADDDAATEYARRAQLSAEGLGRPFVDELFGPQDVE
jgi:DNA-binding SARP family transcriptional activator